MKIYDELKSRGLIVQVSNEEKIKYLLDNEQIRFYVGTDPTADSMHVGHFVQFMTLSHLQNAGHFPIILFGGGTAMIGDPSGKTDMRRIITPEEINYNICCFKKQASKFIDVSNEKCIIVNNADWLNNLKYIEFLREIGTCFSVNKMLAADCYKQRLEKGLSFLELNYMIMQGYDFLYLFKNYGCVLQFGGNDQWSNILSGVDLIRRKERKEVFAMTSVLLTTSEGKKMGKTEKGALWLDAKKTSPYEFYQYWRNIHDADVINCFKILTFLPLEEIKKYENLHGEQLNLAKEILAFEVTKLVHGESEAKKAQSAAKNIFSGDKTAIAVDFPTTKLTKNDFTNEKIDILTLLTKVEIANSKSDARRLIEQGGILVNNEKISDIGYSVDINEFKNDFIVQKGKKVHKKVVVS